MALINRCSLALMLAGLSGCVVAPLPQRPLPLVAVPGPAKTAAAFQQDDAACRASAAPARPAPAPEPGQSGPSTGPDAAPPDQSQDAAAAAAGVYLHCMEAHNNVVQPLVPLRPPTYGYYGPYDGYAPYPWLYDGYPGYWGGYFGVGYGYGWRGGWHGGYGYGGGFHGGGRR